MDRADSYGCEPLPKGFHMSCWLLLCSCSCTWGSVSSCVGIGVTHHHAPSRGCCFRPSFQMSKTEAERNGAAEEILLAGCFEASRQRRVCPIPWAQGQVKSKLKMQSRLLIFITLHSGVLLSLWRFSFPVLEGWRSAFLDGEWRKG